MFGVTDANYLNSVVDHWFNDRENYDGRWQQIEHHCKGSDRILDMAAGCGTFVLYGLNCGHDVFGIEPEEWKREYYRQKIASSSYPPEFGGRILAGYGESLPFPNNSFDLVTSYQTLEHVQDLNACIHEMLRITRTGGAVWIITPDYNSFFEGHYRIPFLPCMNRKLAAAYLRLLGRPVDGLTSLQYVTKKLLLTYLYRSSFSLRIEDTSKWIATRQRQRIHEILPKSLRREPVEATLHICYRIYRSLLSLRRFARAEGSISLWITKLS